MFKPVDAEFTAVNIKAMTLIFLNELRYELRYKSHLHRFRFRSPMKGTSQKYIEYMGLDFEQYTVKIIKGPPFMHHGGRLIAL